MTRGTFKNYLRTCRKKLDLSQAEIAAILGLESPEMVSRWERGLAIPTLEESIALRVLFKKRFEDLWPYVNYEFEARADNNIRRFMRSFEKDLVTSGRLEKRAKLLYQKLSVIVNGDSDGTDPIT
ncbi:MAG TPA: helix-turn-helix transcriptional regulator [Terriglobia bacterium]|jgi:transcriptional regulator with XRE-family HTH domain